MVKRNDNRQFTVKVNGGNLKLVKVPGFDPALWVGSKPGGWLDIKGEVICQIRMAVSDSGASRFECRIDIAGKNGRQEDHRLDSGTEYSIEGAVAWIKNAAAKYL